MERQLRVRQFHGRGFCVLTWTNLRIPNANCFGVRTWDSAMSAAATLANGQCGLTDGSAAGDWRLPTTSTQVGGELSSIDGGELEVIYNAKNDPVFSSVQSSYYWSSTTDADITSDAWDVYLSSGYVGSSGKTNGDDVWPVRGGQ